MNEKYMNMAIKQAIKAFKKKEVPVGAVIVHNNKIIAKACNDRQNKKSVIGHAEINAILKASKRLGDWRLNECDLYVTLKPCAMCESIIKESRIKSVYYILEKPLQKKQYDNTSFKRTSVRYDYENLLSNFFKNKR